MNVNKAIEFIEQNGTPFQKSWFQSVMYGKKIEETLQYIESFQNTDGGFIKIDPDYKGTISSVTCTMIALKKLEFMNVKEHEILDRIKKYLKAVQRKEGFWDEESDIVQKKIPKWYYPKYRVNQIWFTNGLLRYIKVFFPEENEMIALAKKFLLDNWENEKFRGYYHNNYMAVVGFSDWTNQKEQEIYTKCMDNLYYGISAYDYYDAIWAIQSLVDLGIEQEDKVVKKALSIIYDSYMEDGGFQSNYGLEQRVDATIASLATLVHYGKIQLEE